MYACLFMCREYVYDLYVLAGSPRYNEGLLYIFLLFI